MIAILLLVIFYFTAYAMDKPFLQENLNRTYLGMVPKDIQNSLAPYVLYPLKSKLLPIECYPNFEKSIATRRILSLEASDPDHCIAAIANGHVSFYDTRVQETFICGDENSAPRSSCIQKGQSQLLIGDYSGKIAIWDLQKKRKLQSFLADIGPITNITSFDDIFISVGTGSIKIWNANSYQLLNSVESAGIIKKASLLNRAILMYVSLNGNIAQYDIEKNDIISICLAERISQMALIDSYAVLSHSTKDDYRLSLFDQRQKELALEFKPTDARITALHTDGSLPYFVSGGWDGMVKVWDLRMPCHNALLLNKCEWVRCLCSTDSMKKIISPASDFKIKIWDINSLHQLDHLPLAKVVSLCDTNKFPQLPYFKRIALLGEFINLH